MSKNVSKNLDEKMPLNNTFKMAKTTLKYLLLLTWFLRLTENTVLNVISIVKRKFCSEM